MPFMGGVSSLRKGQVAWPQVSAQPLMGCLRFLVLAHRPGWVSLRRTPTQRPPSLDCLRAQSIQSETLKSLIVDLIL